MGARLYNSETGRFMSVDPLMEIFTGHSPYHYSYNNPVMFNDPSGLAPEGEKNNKTQGLGDDAIVAGQTIGYWSLHNTLYIDYRAVRDFEDSRGTSYVYSFSMSTSLEESYVWVTTRGIGGISDTRAGSASIDSPSEMWGTDRYRGSTSTKKYIDPNSLRSKSMRDQN
ncbi:MAG: RHS repeat-associated core domain-containing protein [Candidatus Kapaibacterium sp.]